MLQITNYRKAYETQAILSIASFALKPGTYWLKGENGSGKSTFLRSLAGVIPFEGEVQVFGNSLRRKRIQYTRDVSFAEAEPIFPTFLTGNDLIHFFQDAKGTTSKHTEELKQRFGAQHFLKNKVGSYSSGMIKKLSLILAFIGQPKLILLDEPFITLDIDAVTVLNEIISSCRKHTSFIISSHHELSLDIPYEVLQIQQQTIIQTTHVLAVQ